MCRPWLTFKCFFFENYFRSQARILFHTGPRFAYSHSHVGLYKWSEDRAKVNNAHYVSGRREKPALVWVLREVGTTGRRWARLGTQTSGCNGFHSLRSGRLFYLSFGRYCTTTPEESKPSHSCHSHLRPRIFHWLCKHRPCFFVAADRVEYCESFWILFILINNHNISASWIDDLSALPCAMCVSRR